jgi:hypothetical protein
MAYAPSTISSQRVTLSMKSPNAERTLSAERAEV